MNSVAHYNVYFEMAGAIILSIIYAYLKVIYPKKSVSLQKYSRMFAVLIVANILDIVSAVMNEYATSFSNIFLMIFNTLYFCSIIVLQISYFEYVLTFLNKDIKKWIKILNAAVLGIYLILLIVNIFTGWIFYFNEASVYSRGPLYFVVYATVVYYMAIGYFVIFTNKVSVSGRKLFSVIFFTIMQIAGSALQIFVFPNTLLTCFTASIALIAILFAIETPDYAKLMETMEELEKNKKELELMKDAAIAAQHEAEEANRAKSSFLASMSHEIRTPINGMLGMNSIIMKEVSDTRILEYAKNIDNAGNGLLSIINDILDFSKIESGKMELAPVNYDLSNVLSSCYNMEFLPAREKGLELYFENNPTIPCDLFGDEVRIRQIITNILNNAVKYTEKGMVVLTADWERIDDYNMELMISVKDTGIGIKEENIDTIFEAFERVDLKKNRNIEGTGLGLGITKKFVDMMGGSISVESEYGVGSEFTVRIPQRITGKHVLGDFARYVHISSDDAMEVFSRFKCPKGRILIVDDVALNLKVLKGLLKESELTVDEALSGKECLELLKENTYDLILLDIMMPEMDGVETLNAMRSMNDVFNVNTPVIALTADAIQGAREKYIKEGFTDYLSKPVREQELNEMLIKYLPDEALMVFDVTMEQDAKAITDDEDNTEGHSEVPSADSSSAAPSSVAPSIREEKSALEKRFPFLDVKSGLTYCLNDEEFYESIVREFSASNKYDDIQTYYDVMDIDNYVILVHGVKSSALTIGATYVSELAKKLEYAGKADDKDYIKKNHYIFMREYGELLDNLDEVYGR